MASTRPLFVSEKVKVNGRNRHIAVDTCGLLLCVLVHSAGVQDRDGAKPLLETLRSRFGQIRLVWADGGYVGKLIAWCQNAFGWTLEIIKRNSPGFEVLPRRWVVERTFACLGKCRRLSKDYEYTTASSEAFVHLARSISCSDDSIKDFSPDV